MPVDFTVCKLLYRSTRSTKLKLRRSICTVQIWSTNGDSMEILFYMKNKCLYKLEYMICLWDELVAKQAKVSMPGLVKVGIWRAASSGRSNLATEATNEHYTVQLRVNAASQCHPCMNSHWPNQMIFQCFPWYCIVKVGEPDTHTQWDVFAPWPSQQTRRWK